MMDEMIGILICVFNSLQVQIFLRGAQLAKVGGRIVYSTCSFNPVENEAVVAEVLRLSKGKRNRVEDE
jgi:16S rRNA C967 or C1407 C5-methylase (RsmB/RsmF family)